MPAQQPPLPANAYGVYGNDPYAQAAAQGVMPHHAGAHAGMGMAMGMMGMGYGDDAAGDAYRHSNAHVAYDPYAGYVPTHHPAQAAPPVPGPSPPPVPGPTPPPGAPPAAAAAAAAAAAVST